MKFLLVLLSIPYYRLKARMTPNELIWLRGLIGEISPASADFFRSHPDTVQLFHRIMSHRLRSPDTYQGQPVLTTLLRDIRDITPAPIVSGQSEADALIAALRPLRQTHFDVFSVIMDGVCAYLNIQIPDDEEQ